jgi:EF-P beta-lysylation protein EpmB
MIAASHNSSQFDTWQSCMRAAITDPRELLQLLDVDMKFLPAARLSAARFGLRVPRGFLARIRRGDIDDPVLRQILPLGAELDDRPQFVADAVGDLAAARVPGLIQKYRGRALLIASGSCAVHCRYCFRREFPYGEHTASRADWRAALAQLAGDSSIHEVILSGGDPLSLGDAKLAALTRGLAGISHIKRLRIHTRQPVVLPERVDAAFCGWLRQTQLQKVMVLHINHAQEIGPELVAACAALLEAGVVLLNQSVLLAGVNDDVDALHALSEALMAMRVLPYYLSLLDRVRGSGHFEVSEERAKLLVGTLMGRVPGYLVPRLVREIPGQASKTPVAVSLMT